MCWQTLSYSDSYIQHRATACIEMVIAESFGLPIVQSMSTSTVHCGYYMPGMTSE